MKYAKGWTIRKVMGAQWGKTKKKLAKENKQKIM
jgi:hypothetical protein